MLWWISGYVAGLIISSALIDEWTKDETFNFRFAVILTASIIWPVTWAVAIIIAWRRSR